MAVTILILGSNIGDKKQNIQLAQEFIFKKVGTIVRESSIYKTQAWGMPELKEEESIFYNKALVVDTESSPLILLDKIQNIETILGRKRSYTIRYTSRIIDIDILFYDNLTFAHERLVIPHPKLHLRKFVLIPLNEIMPDLVHPVFNKSIQSLLQECTDELLVEKI